MAPKESVIVESPTAEERAFQQHVAARGEDEHDADEESVAGIEEGEGEEGHERDETLVPEIVIDDEQHRLLAARGRKGSVSATAT